MKKRRKRKRMRRKIAKKKTRRRRNPLLKKRRKKKKDDEPEPPKKLIFAQEGQRIEAPPEEDDPNEVLPPEDDVRKSLYKILSKYRSSCVASQAMSLLYAENELFRKVLKKAGGIKKFCIARPNFFNFVGEGGRDIIKLTCPPDPDVKPIEEKPKE